MNPYGKIFMLVQKAMVLGYVASGLQMLLSKGLVEF
jgi:hypothetical protein